MDLKEKIIDLIETKREDDYWDFKESWHHNKANLLHDIICLANNRTDKDGLLIFGIRDTSYEIIGIEEDVNRKNQQNVIDFLKDKNFIGNIRPSIELKTISYKEHEIDILIVKNTNDTPYYLTDDYSHLGKIVKKCHIYTRVKDTNTPLENGADINHVEYLWKKRFNLTISPIRRIFEELKNKNNWESKYNNKMDATIYHNINIPEFTMQLIEEEDDLRAEFYAYTMINKSTSYGRIIVKYFDTEVFSTQYVYLDGGRYITPTPAWGFIELEKNKVQRHAYKYFIKNSNEEILQQFLFEEKDDSSIYAKEKFDSCVLYFDDEIEKKNFENIILTNADKILGEIVEIKNGISLIADNDSETEYMKQHIAIGIVFKKWKKEMC